MPQNNKYVKILKEELQHVKKRTHFNLSKTIEQENKSDIEFNIIKRTYTNSKEIPSHISLQKGQSKYLNIQDSKPVINNKSNVEISLKKEAKDIKILGITGNDAKLIEEIYNNPFCNYMYLRPDVKAKYYTRFFVKEKGLLPLNIKSIANSKKVSKNSAAHFNPFEGEVHYKNEYITPSTAAHEVEHAFQHSLIGKDQSGFSPFQKRAFNLLGSCTKNEKSKALRYKKANDNYPRDLSNITNLREYPPYWKNGLERGAREYEELYQEFDRYPFSDLLIVAGF